MGSAFGSWMLLALLVVVVGMMLVGAINDHRMQQAMRETLRELADRSKAHEQTMDVLLEHVGLVEAEGPPFAEQEPCARLSGTLSEDTERFGVYRPGRHR